MTDRPILFSAPMVRAILEGRKAVTRRPVRARHASGRLHDEALRVGVRAAVDAMPSDIRCPYGVPGDRLWVRETHWADRGCAPDDHPKIHYRADMAEHDHCGSGICPTPNGLSRHPGPWTPSIHMPRWASRISLEVVSVTVERVQDITREDAIREGATSRLDECGHEYWQLDWSRLGTLSRYARGSGGTKVPLTVSDIGLGTPRHAFGHLWEQIHGPGAWGRNDWVWRIEFRRMDQ